MNIHLLAGNGFLREGSAGCAGQRDIYMFVSHRMHLNNTKMVCSASEGAKLTEREKKNQPCAPLDSQDGDQSIGHCLRDWMYFYNEPFH